jgi:hypothetical protein
MDKRVAQLKQSVADLSRAFEDLSHRMAELEARAGVRAASSPLAAVVTAPAAASEETDAVAILSLVGRSCLVLGGAYLLRALTDGGTLPRIIGTVLGLAYGVGWFVAVWRAAGARRIASSAFHAIAAVLIVFPLLWESTVRFHLLSQADAAVAMAGAAAAADAGGASAAAMALYLALHGAHAVAFTRRGAVRGHRVRIDGADVIARPQQVDEIPARPAAGVEDAHSRYEVAAQQLVEQADVDLAEERGGVRRVAGHAAIVAPSALRARGPGLRSRPSPAGAVAPGRGRLCCRSRMSQQRGDADDPDDRRLSSGCHSRNLDGSTRRRQRLSV